MTARTVHIEDFWHASDGDDWQPAFVRAQASVVNFESLTIVLHQRQYRCLAPIELFHHVQLKGPEGHGRVNFNSVDSGANRQVCTLYFPQSAGIIVRYVGNYTADVTARADFCTIQDVALRGPGFNYAVAGARDMHGLSIEFTAEVRRFSIRGFPGNGLHVVADVTGTPPSNANFCKAEDGFIIENGGAGVYNAGGDGNHCLFMRISCNNNGRYFVQWTATPTSASVASRMVTATYAALPSEMAIGQQIHGFGCTVGGVRQDFLFGVVTQIVGNVVTIDTSRDPRVIPDGTLVFGVGSNTLGMRTYAVSAVTAAGRRLTMTTAPQDFRRGDCAFGHGFTASDGNSGDFTFGHVLPGTTSTSALIDTSHDSGQVIRDGAYTDSVGFVAIRGAQFFGQALIGSLWLNCDTGANQNGGESFVGINANTYLFCYDEGAGTTTTCRIILPALAIGGALAPNPLTGLLSGGQSSLRVTPSLETINPRNTRIMARLGSTIAGGVLEWLNGANTLRVQFGVAEPNTWEFVDANAGTLVPLRISDAANVRHGRAELWMPRGFRFGNITKESALGTSSTRAYETGTLDTMRCLYEIYGENNVVNTLASAGTAAIILTHALPVYATDGLRDLRMVVRNVGGSTIVNGVHRGRVATGNTIQLYNLTTGAALTFSGTYTANTGVAGVYRAVLDGVAPPTSATTFFAIGDLVRNAQAQNGIYGWLCIESGTPGRWAPMRVQGDSGIAAPAAFPYNASVFDDVIMVDGAAAVKVINLPAIGTHHTRRITVKDRLGNAGPINTITIIPHGAETIDGGPNIAINAAFGVVRLIAGNGAAPTNWSVM